MLFVLNLGCLLLLIILSRSVCTKMNAQRGTQNPGKYRTS